MADDTRTPEEIAAEEKAAAEAKAAHEAELAKQTQQPKTTSRGRGRTATTAGGDDSASESQPAEPRDVSIPGGRYMVGDQMVDANGKPIDKKR